MQNIIWNKNLKTCLAETHINKSYPAPLLQGSRSLKYVVKIDPNSTLLMIGDSITDCGHITPAAETVRDALGYGYVKLINEFFSATCPRQHIRIINKGVNGNTVRNLAVRWQSDVLDLKPDWLSIMIGINDVWAKFDAGQPDELCVSIEEFASTLEQLIHTTRSQLKGMVLMTPYCIEPNRADPMRAMMDRYGDVVRRLAGQYQAILVDTQEAFDCVLTEVHSTVLSLDRVHLNPAGHIILAQAFLKALDNN